MKFGDIFISFMFKTVNLQMVTFTNGHIVSFGYDNWLEGFGWLTPSEKFEE